ncbi:MAG: outer membrane lipoprotein-sorting protein [Myxococcota bacterium]|nr:outer membrane lipoprotein-sorting protein [Myxococcota bacterium]
MKCRAMATKLIIGLVLIFSAAGWANDRAAPNINSPEFATHIMQRIDDQYRGDKSHGIMEMAVKTRHWTRTMSLESWSLGKAYSLVRILSPKKERGTATLKAKDTLFTYLKKTGRTIKITSGMMGGAWMGSHFTNDDLIRHTRLSEDYAVRLSFSGNINGVDAYRFVLTPKPDAPVVWGKLEIVVRASDLAPLSQVYFAEDGQKVRSLVFSKHETIGDRIIPKEMIMTPLDKPGEYTRITWKKIAFNLNLDKGFFTIQKLKSM